MYIYNVKLNFKINKKVLLIIYHIIEDTLYITAQSQTVPFYLYLDDFYAGYDNIYSSNLAVEKTKITLNKIEKKIRSYHVNLFI